MYTGHTTTKRWKLHLRILEEQALWFTQVRRGHTCGVNQNESIAYLDTVKMRLNCRSHYCVASIDVAEVCRLDIDDGGFCSCPSGLFGDECEKGDLLTTLRSSDNDV